VLDAVLVLVLQLVVPTLIVILVRLGQFEFQSQSSCFNLIVTIAIPVSGISIRLSFSVWLWEWLSVLVSRWQSQCNHWSVIITISWTTRSSVTLSLTFRVLVLAISATRSLQILCLLFCRCC